MKDTSRGNAAGIGKQRSATRVEEWFSQWRRPLRNYLATRSSIPAADVDDLAQEVFLRLLRYSDQQAVENPQGYLFRIAANVANEWRERARHRRPHDQSWLHELQIDSWREPQNVVARTRAHENVRQAVRALPQRQRQVLLLHISEGLTYKQIAVRLNVTYRIVLRDLTRAYSRLRMQLNMEDLSELGK